MTIGDQAARCYMAGWDRFQTVRGLGWVERGDGFFTAYSGLADCEFNEVFLFDECAPDEITRQLAELRRTGAPYALRARPGLTETAAAIAETLGMTAHCDVPLMALSQSADATRADDIQLRPLSEAENALHVALMASGFDGPLDVIQALTPPQLMNESGVHIVGGLLDDALVTTAVVDVHGDSGWIFNVVTLDAYRRRGFGFAVTAAAAELAFADGASAVFLLATPLGELLYTRMGFRCLEHWSVWAAT